MAVSRPKHDERSSFLHLWLLGYTHPVRLVDALPSWPAPHTGFYAQLLRASLDSLLVYLPLALMHRVPPERPYLAFIPADRYYAALILLGPLVLLLELLVGAAIIHIILRLARRRSDFDLLINLGGMSALVVGAILIPWDWFWVIQGGVDQIFLGVTHLLISLWAWVIIALGIRRLLGVPAWLAVLATLVSTAGSMPFAIMFMRSPL